MAPKTLDHMLDSYLDNATASPRVITCCDKTLVYTKFAGDDITGQGESIDAALESLREVIRQRVYRAMNANRALPVIAGINITPGSC